MLAEIETGAKNLQVLNTHLHHVDDDSETRQEQVPVLIDVWNGAPRTVLLGDLNATPDSVEMNMLAEAGLSDVGGIIGPDPGYTFYSADLDSRIDYFWTSPDLVPALYAVRQTTASDHLPLATTITIPVRNLHSTVGVASMKDVNATIKLVRELLKYPPKFLNT